MYPLTVSEAILLVRKNYDEIASDDSDMTDIIDDKDSNEFEDVLAKTLPEAINAVHALADVTTLDGEVLPEDATVSFEGDCLKIEIPGSFLRMVAFKEKNSLLTICDTVDEYSAEGRMQLNPYTRGTADHPRMVLMQTKKDDKTVLKYYSVERKETSPASNIERLEYIKRYKHGSTSYNVADDHVTTVIDHLTGMMCSIYGDVNKAQYFFQKAGTAVQQPAQ